MTITAPQLRSAAALLAAVPGLACRLTLDEGDELVAGEHSDAQMCGHSFHDFIRERHERLNVSDLTIDGVDPATGLACHQGMRWFVSPMPASATVACLRDAGYTRAPWQALVRTDEDLGVSVVAVRDQSGHASTAELDAVAVAAYGACLVEHLIVTTP
ncbi:hypothetical protein [Demequina sediminicola]|uniref:hypothetical protein n=1 Tax=Demequina sediminicola TaxID=1095026 RepID=UPI000784AE9A|nr:hypothetical protein [Demequina sediminicola]